MIRPYKLAGLFLLLFSMAFQVSARLTGDEMLLIVHGTLRNVTHCTVNDGKLISIVFGNVGINKVDGNHFQQTLDYRIGCQGVGERDVTLRVSGTPVSYDAAAIASSVEGLGIRIMADGQPLPLNQDVNIDYNQPPVLEVVPVKDPAVELTGAPFNASATLSVLYQ